MNRHDLASASFALSAALCSCLTSAHATTLAPHRAFYDLEVKRLEQGNNIATIKGKLAYEITGSRCDGYAVSYRIANRIVYGEGGSQVIDTHMSSWESGDGLELDIAQKQFVDAKLSSESRTKVRKQAADKPGSGEIVATETKQFETLAAAIFPTQHQMKLIEAARHGEARDFSLVYEGSEEEKSAKVISFIGPQRPVSGIPQPLAATLAGAAAWPVSISYYPADGTADDTPQYQASFLMLDNGISTGLVMDYGSYALSGKLTKLELLEPDNCK